MKTHTMIERVMQALPEAEVIVNTDDNVHYTMQVISDAFEGLSPVKRQQRIMRLFQSEILSGDIHALTLKTWTVAQASTLK